MKTSPKTDQRPRCYSYLRWSSPEQSKGTSRERQSAYAAKFAEEKGLTLDETMVDDGMSAYDGTNVAKGKLGKFLIAVEAGEIPKGSYLVIENLDRISRQAPLASLDILRKLIDNGITVVTADDRQEYNKSSYSDSPYELIKTVLQMQLAHEESRKKSDRVKRAFKLQIEDYSNHKTGRIKSGATPSWIRVNEDGTAFSLIEQRARVVEKIFKLYVAGRGTILICRELNEAGIEPFGYASGMWPASSIELILKSPSTYGPATFRPLLGEPVTFENYYPPAISKELFFQAQAIRRNRATTKSVSPTCPSFITGIGITYCGYCGSAMVSQQAGGKGVRDDDGNLRDWARRIRCKGASTHSTDCIGGTLKASLIENAVLDYCSDQMTGITEIVKQAGESELDLLRLKLSSMKSEQHASQEAISNLVNNFEQLTVAPKQMIDRMTELENGQREREQTIEMVTSDIEALERAAPEKFQEELELLRAMLDGDEQLDARLRLRQIMVGMLERIEIYVFGANANKDASEELASHKQIARNEDDLNQLQAFATWGKKNKEVVDLKFRFLNGIWRTVQVARKTGKFRTYTQHGGDQETIIEVMRDGRVHKVGSKLEELKERLHLEARQEKEYEKYLEQEEHRDQNLRRLPKDRNH